MRFLFGYDALPNLVRRADGLPERAWPPWQRPARYTVKTAPRDKPARVHEQLVVARGVENKRLQAEAVAECNYQPTACAATYRLVVVRKNISVAKGEQPWCDDIRYFCSITTDWGSAAEAIVFSANDRGQQENLLAQLKSGLRSLTAPVDNLVSTGASMVMTSWAWNLKAGWALTLPETPGRWQSPYRADKLWVLKIEFKTFVNAFVRLPCQLVRTGRKLVSRLLAWNPYQPIFFRLLSALRG